jgi:hypothetical protein
MLAESSPRLHEFIAAQPAHELWQLVTAPGTVRFDVPASPAARRRLRQQVQELPPGANVVLGCSALGSRGRCRRFARYAGIEILREYIAVPSASQPTCYVESSPAALRYFFTQLLTVPRGRAGMSAALAAVKRVAGFIWPVDVLGSFAPIRIVVGRTLGSATVSATDAAEPGSGEGHALLDVPGMRTVVLALSKDPNAKVTVLLMPRGSQRPTRAIKVPTTAEAMASVATERRVLADLHARLPRPILASIPRLLELPEFRGRPLLVTTALAGSPMSTRYHAWRHIATPASVRGDFAAVQAWLAKFQSLGTGPTGPVDMDGGASEVLRRRFADDPRVGEVLARLAAVHARLRATSTPRTAVHGDFWFGNLLLVGDHISGVIDWEAGSACGEPMRDVVRFAITYSLYLDRHTRPGQRVAGHKGLRAGEWGAGIAWAVDGDGWYPDLVREFVRGGLSRLGADPDCWRDAMMAGLADVAASADHIDFARSHWRLLDRLTES